MIELMVTMALMGIVAAALGAVIVSATNAEVRTSKTFQAQVQGSVALDKLRRELHCAASVTVVSSTGSAVGAGTAGAGINTILGGYCPTNGLTQNAASTVYVTWCTKASTLLTGEYALYRLASLSSQPACATTGVKWADYLTTSTPFCLPSTATACSGVFRSPTSLQTLRVALPLNLNGASSLVQGFNLVDFIALRNSARA
jgi:type II secretory pathway pseudopilin PulG